MFSSNFEFLAPISPQLAHVGKLAERYYAEDPNTTLIKLRQFGEILARALAQQVGEYVDEYEKQVELLRRLESSRVIAGRVVTLFHELRKVGNTAVHDLAGNSTIALSHLKYAHQLGIFFYRVVTGDRSFFTGVFVPPPDPLAQTEDLKAELARLRLELGVAEAARIELEQARWSLAETERLAKVELPPTVIEVAGNISAAIDLSQKLSYGVELDERETRILIDTQLRSVGWEVDSLCLNYPLGTRPMKNRYLAIAEYPVKDGVADYILFIGLQPVAAIEAKRSRKEVSTGALDQAQRYSRNYISELGAMSWGDYQLPFVYGTNGREYLEQLKTASGIWFRDVRRETNLRYPLQGWHSPQGLEDLLKVDIDLAFEKLSDAEFDYNFGLRDYQIRAIQAVEAALKEEQRNILLAMATGTGKTKTSIAMVYRLIKAQRFKRVLFLVDRSALGSQTARDFGETRLENLQTFAEIFGFQGLENTKIDRDNKVQIATIQGMIKRVLYAEDNLPLPVDTYDCIVVDECHRGYTLDRELSDRELTFRDAKDYVSKYRRVLDYFDAVKIGLTATPALHTVEIFGTPVYQYTYREAVLDGTLIDCEPPIKFTTQLSADGIIYKVGEKVDIYNPKIGAIESTITIDEIDIQIEQFNRNAIVPNFNRVVCEELTNYLDLDSQEKTLIFCVTDRHADLVVDLLKQSLQATYGEIPDRLVAKITGASDKPQELIKEFRNEIYPQIAVTVDLLTTGIDIPKICNLVFLRRVNSRILYEQMLGRATRRCDEIGKERFRIFDAVRLYEGMEAVSDMKPIAVNPQLSFGQLFAELDRIEDPTNRRLILDQSIAKLQRQLPKLPHTRREQIEQLCGSIESILDDLKSDRLPSNWNSQAIAAILDARDGGSMPLILVNRADTLIATNRGYGAGLEPQDYLANFDRYLKTNLNQIPALITIAQRPRELTRADLKSLRLELDKAGFTEVNLQIAWREVSNQDIAATVIGFIRRAAIGDALIPYEERVKTAIGKVLNSRYNWTEPQRKWLERIGKQLVKETIVDRASLDGGVFKENGGFKRINKIFNGEIESILMDIQGRMWE